MIDIELRSSGWGPRSRWTGQVKSPEAEAAITSLGVMVNYYTRHFPRDGVAIIIRRVE